MNKKIALTIEVSQETYDKLEEQLENIKSNADSAELKSFVDVRTVEELIENYVKQIALMNETYTAAAEKMESLFRKFEEKGVDLNDFFTSLFPNKDEKKQQEEEKVNDSTPVDDKKSSVKKS
ncbi:hypothetical protein J2Z62_000194 [Mycoplasmoides fastidiosum]|uniref:Uncharacterized protein n=1 Tax=Mycoplasmoides fastidiosum TaxID=92758 RepID=A0ABU0LYG6_9BACT|nr:hypothetical protein [Mycoplasmoides fastidiosum]MDQ0513756.1 hypothetical protein [Mycoplasmoides fastidiosum]UUD37823.1 hypothetical protein NPA10_00285 [Mycoplasmoides fastidiosum]